MGWFRGLEVRGPGLRAWSPAGVVGFRGPPDFCELTRG